MEVPASRSALEFEAVTLLLAATPPILIVLSWNRWSRTVAPSQQRRWAALGGLICGSLGAMGLPVYFLILSLHQRIQWLDHIESPALALSLVGGFFASLAGIPLAAFAWGKVRWLALPACALSLVLCYVAVFASAS